MGVRRIQAALCLWLAFLAGCASSQPRPTQSDLTLAIKTWADRTPVRYQFNIKYVFDGCAWISGRVHVDGNDIHYDRADSDFSCKSEIARSEEGALTVGMNELFSYLAWQHHPSAMYSVYDAEFDREYGYPASLKMNFEFARPSDERADPWEYEHRISGFRVFEFAE